MSHKKDARLITLRQPEDPDQHEHDNQVYNPIRVAVDTRLLNADSEDSDQTGPMPSLIGVFAVRAVKSVGYVSWPDHRSHINMHGKGHGILPFLPFPVPKAVPTRRQTRNRDLIMTS